MSYPIGTELTRRDLQGDALDEIKIVGGDSKSLSVQPAKEFGAVVRMSAAAVRAEYQTDDNLEHSQAFDRPTYLDPGKSPEEVFNDAARASSEPAKPNAAAKVAAANAAAEAAEAAAEAAAVEVEAVITVEEPQETEAETLKAEAALGDQHATKTRRKRGQSS